jgi:2-dehydropantoate 2-reductase
MRAAIIGAGAVGIGLGTCLLSSNTPVRIVVRSADQRGALEAAGMQRSGLFGEAAFGPDRFQVLSSLAPLRDGRDDVWLVCTKATACSELAREIASLFSDDPEALPPIVLCQNGWGNAEAFAEHLPREKIFNARVITGFERSDSTHVRITVHADSIRIGNLFEAPTEPLAALCRAIDEGGIPCELSRTLEQDLLAKLLYNCLLNPLGALAGVPYGVLGERPETRAIMNAIAAEIFRVLSASGLRTHWGCAADYLETFYQRLLPPTAGHQSSMLQDLRGRRTTEIDVISGAVHALATRHGIEAPVNHALLTLVHAAEKRGVNHD